MGRVHIAHMHPGLGIFEILQGVYLAELALSYKALDEIKEILYPSVNRLPIKGRALFVSGIERPVGVIGRT